MNQTQVEDQTRECLKSVFREYCAVFKRPHMQSSSNCHNNVDYDLFFNIVLPDLTDWYEEHAPKTLEDSERVWNLLTISLYNAAQFIREHPDSRREPTIKDDCIFYLKQAIADVQNRSYTI